ncbi:MAG TPA: amidohydrolase family protein [Dehalococcoidia bacterium]|nr:amidohydrolase family protein [Dehalococcoidia bacterium]
MTLMLSGGQLWDGLTPAVTSGSIHIDGQTIVDRSADEDGETVDVSGCTIIPGLIEAHAHLCFNAQSDWRETYDAESPERLLLRMSTAAGRMLNAGITTVRDLGAPTSLAIELRDAIRDGLTPGPYLLVAGAPITTTGGHCWFLGGEADGELGLRIRVRELAKAGVDWIKVMATGGNMTPGTNVNEPQFSLQELRAIVDESARLGLRVAAHCHGTPGIRNAAEAGVATIEHCSFRGEDGLIIDDEVAALIAERGVAVSPTVHSGYLRGPDSPVHDQRMQVAAGILDAGCQVIMSTDCGIPGTPHDVLPRSIAVWAEQTGTAPVDALASATSRSAAILGLDDRGTLEPGKRADLLVVAGNPLDDLTALQRVRLVVQAGQVARNKLD